MNCTLVSIYIAWLYDYLNTSSFKCVILEWFIDYLENSMYLIYFFFLLRFLQMHFKTEKEAEEATVKIKDIDGKILVNKAFAQQ